MSLRTIKDRLRPLRDRLGLRRGQAAAEAEAAPEAAPPEAAAGYRIEITFSDVAWRLTISDGEGGGEARQGDLFDAAAREADGDGVAAGLRAALRALAPGERAMATSVALYPVTSDIALYDSRSVRAFGADAAAFRNAAADLAGTTDCVFDRARFAAGEDDRQVIAVAGVELMRRCISILGDLAPRLVRIAPASLAWAAVDGARGSAGTLHVGRSASMFVCVDPASGVLAARAIDVGLADLVTLISEANSLPKTEAAKEMAARDMLARAVAAGLDAPLEALAGLVRSTLDYVAESRLAEPPARIVLAGGHTAAHGLAALLAERIGLDVEPGEMTPPAVPIAMNLLRSTEGPLFSEGTKAYRFVEDRFIGEETEARKPKAAASKAESKPGGKSGGAAIERIGLRLPAFVTDASGKRLAAMGAGVALLLAFLFYDQLLSPAGQAHARAAARYGDGLTRSAALAAQIRALRSDARRDAILAGAANKILWAEKFVSIAAALPPSLWLTDASIAAQDRKVGQVDVVATKLILRGVARSTGERRLQDIASFIETLERDEAFMRDFRELTFAGLGGEGVEARAGANAGAADAGAVFEVHAWYDENKRRADGAVAEGDPGADPLGAAAAAAANRAQFSAGGVLGGQR